jgi:hypothetical protein
MRPYLEKPFTKIGLKERLKVKTLSSSPSTTKKEGGGEEEEEEEEEEELRFKYPEIGGGESLASVTTMTQTPASPSRSRNLRPALPRPVEHEHMGSLGGTNRMRAFRMLHPSSMCVALTALLPGQQSPCCSLGGEENRHPD